MGKNGPQGFVFGRRSVYLRRKINLRISPQIPEGIIFFQKTSRHTEIDAKMNFVIFDLEATCWENGLEGRTQEIIEIGAVLLNEERELIGRYDRFIRPTVHPLLSDFCRQLTSISQLDVNRADLFPEVVEDFMEWFGYHDDEEYLLCSWGHFDRRALERDCKLHGLESEWTDRHISLKHQYQEIRRLPKGPGLKSTVEREGFEFEGTHHRADSDAENLAKVFLKYYDVWRY